MELQFIKYAVFLYLVTELSANKRVKTGEDKHALKHGLWKLKGCTNITILLDMMNDTANYFYLRQQCQKTIISQ